MSSREDYPPVEGTILADPCECSVADVEAALRALGLPPLSYRWLARLVHLRRVAWHLGTVLEPRRRRRSGRLWEAGARGIVKVNFTSPAGELTADYYLVRGDELTGAASSPASVDEWETYWREEGHRFHYTTFMEHAGPVHAS